MGEPKRHDSIKDGRNKASKQKTCDMLKQKALYKRNKGANTGVSNFFFTISSLIKQLICEDRSFN